MPLTKQIMIEALGSLDKRIPDSVELLVGGESALVLGYEEAGATQNLDATPLRSALTFDELKPFIHEVAHEMKIAKDWINPYFGSFANVLPNDFRTRTIEVFSGEKLSVIILSPEDLLIMKVMAGRKRDDRHIRKLMARPGVQLAIVESQLEYLTTMRITGADDALDRFDEYKSDLGI